MKSENGRGLKSLALTRLWSDESTSTFTFEPWLYRNGRPVVFQRLIISSICGLLAFALTAAWLDLRIRQSLLKEVAQSSSWFVTDHIQPILLDLRPHQPLPDATRQRLTGLINKSMLGHKLVEMRVWGVDKEVLFSTNAVEIGMRLFAAPELSGALAGATTYELLDRDDPSFPPRWHEGHWMLEVFYPVLARGTNSVIAVAELYLDGSEFVGDMSTARWQSWLIAAILGAVIFAIVFGFAWHVSNIVGSQAQKIDWRRLQNKKELSLIERNKQLAQRVREEHSRNVESSDRLLRHIGADLHDGPAQLLSIALLRLGEISTGDTPQKDLPYQLRSVDEARRMTQDALAELRGIAKGLILPQLEHLHSVDAVRLAVANHKQRTLTDVTLEVKLRDRDLPLALKTCLYRCIQEGLNNAYRHGGGREQLVRVVADRCKVVLTIKDAGPGVATDVSRPPIDSLGIAGLRNRIEALGGQFSMVSSAGLGTAINIELPLPALT